MAARKLIVALVVLLAISTALAVLASDIEESREGSREDSEAANSTSAFDSTDPGWRSPAPRNDGRVIEREIEAQLPMEVIKVRVGDRLILEVKGSVATGVFIPELGRYEFLDPVAPARFDLLVSEPGELEVRTSDHGAPIAVIHVAPPAASHRSEPRDRSSARAR